TIADLQDWVEANPDGEIDVDVEGETVTYGGRTVDVTVDDAQRQALVEGIWDTTALMSANENEIERTADSLPYVENA
ncbi:MAG: 3-isopropylmalate dehydratase small subunit, partial [Halorhabdus sp.]